MLTNLKKILLASHGTDGSRAAEQAAFSLCSHETQLSHIFVVPELWKDMMGDDWLNNGVTRDRFGRYLESEIGQEIDTLRERLENEARSLSINYSCEVVLGEPSDCVIKYCNQDEYDLLVVGSPRPKGKPGIRSRLNLDKIVKQTQTPLFVAPYPSE